MFDLVAALRKHLAGAPLRVPESARLTWQCFSDLNATRTYYMGGANPISFAEIEAYARLHRWPLSPRHVAMIRALDDAWMDHVARPSHQGDAKSSPVPPSAAPALTAAAFDAVFG